MTPAGTSNELDVRNEWEENNNNNNSDDGCHRQKRDDERKECSTADSFSKKHERFVADSTVTGCDEKQYCCNGKVENRSTESNDELYTPPRIGLSFAAYHLPLS